jgi:ATP-dependent Clp protease protease subunit
MNPMAKNCDECDMDQMTNNPPSDNNRIWVRAFTPESAEQFGNKVLDASAADSGAPILIYIDSPGGQVDALATMISVMDSVPNHFFTVALGTAFSAGAMLLAHGDDRFATQHSRIMVHQISGGAMGHINDLLTDAKEMERLGDYWMGMLAKDCGKTVKQFKKLFDERRDIYMTAPEAVKFGIIDSIGLPHVMRQQRFVYDVGLLSEEKSKTKVKAS